MRRQLQTHSPEIVQVADVPLVSGHFEDDGIRTIDVQLDVQIQNLCQLQYFTVREENGRLENHLHGEKSLR